MTTPRSSCTRRSMRVGPRTWCSPAPPDQVTRGQARVSELRDRGVRERRPVHDRRLPRARRAGAAGLRVGAIDAISASEHTTLEQLDAAQIYQGVVSRQAEAVAGRPRPRPRPRPTAPRSAGAAAAVEPADHAAGGAAQPAAAHLAALLVARPEPTRRRLAARAAGGDRPGSRGSAAASGTQPPVVERPEPVLRTESGSTAGTVSAATALPRCTIAESQIGKPYQWGGSRSEQLRLLRAGDVGLRPGRRPPRPLHRRPVERGRPRQPRPAPPGRPGLLRLRTPPTPRPSIMSGCTSATARWSMRPYTGADVRYDSIDRPDYIGAVRPYQR